MPATEASPFISRALANAVSTNVDTESPITRDYGRADEAREKWQRLIDYTLLEWLIDPSQVDDEGIEPPTYDTICQAINLAQAFRNADMMPPDSVVPDPNGGIVFERREQDVCEVLHVWDDGTVEYRVFQGARLAARQTL